VNRALQRYLEAASGLTNLTASKAEQIVKGLVRSGEEAGDQVGDLVEDLLERQRRNREAITALVKSETTRAVRAMGLATGKQVERLQKQVVDLKRELRRVEQETGTEDVREQPSAPRVKKTAVMRTATESAPETKATAKRASGKKATAKKASGKKATAKKASGKKATAKKASGKKATAKKASGKKATAKKATGKKATAKKATAQGAVAAAVAPVEADEPEKLERPSVPEAAAKVTEEVAKKATAKKATAKKATAKKATAKKATAKKATAKKATAKKATAKKATAERATAEETAKATDAAPTAAPVEPPAVEVPAPSPSDEPRLADVGDGPPPEVSPVLSEEIRDLTEGS
jgi:polyhydroxyalkanoate synthesis regulator phasin